MSLTLEEAIKRAKTFMGKTNDPKIRVLNLNASIVNNGDILAAQTNKCYWLPVLYMSANGSHSAVNFGDFLSYNFPDATVTAYRILRSKEFYQDSAVTQFYDIITPRLRWDNTTGSLPTTYFGSIYYEFDFN